MTSAEIANFLIKIIPQVLTIVISVTGVFGKGMIEASAEQVAEFASEGGADKEAVFSSSAALASSLITITTFFSTFSVLFILCMAGAMSGKNIIVYLIFGSISVIFVGVIISYLAQNSAYQLSINKVKSPWPIGSPTFLKITQAGLLDRMNLLMIIAIFCVAFL